MNEPLNSTLADRLMKLQGEARGVTFQTDARFILQKKGREGLAKVKAELERLGYPIEYEKIKPMAFYPVGLRILSLLAIQKVFHFSPEDIKRMGCQHPKNSLIVKLFMRFFTSLAKTGKRASHVWKKYYTVGELVVEPHVAARRARLKLKNFSPHPVLCSYFEGGFNTIVQMVVGTPVTTKEIKCVFKGDPYHEYLSTW